VQFLTARDAAAYLMPAFGARASEQFGVVLLDTKHRVMRTVIVATGGLNSTIVEPRDVYREALLGAAAAVVVVHNHPSGDPIPSADDFALTHRLIAAGSLIGIDMVDHMILGDSRYFSFKESGRL
jgi:DNA repair protein RadC